MRVGGFLISQEKGRELTGITGDDLISRSKRNMQLYDMVRKRGGIMEMVTYPQYSTRNEDAQYIVATRYEDFSLRQFYALDKDQTKLAQFIPGVKEERAQKIMESLTPGECLW